MELVTFLITTYNSEKWIDQCIESVINQTHKNLQILIIDDGSEDSTIDHIKKISDSRIELFCKVHSGISKSLNYSLDKIKGEYVARIDSDDYCEPNRISKQLKFLKENESYGIIGSNFILVDETGRQLEKIKNPERHNDIVDQLPRRCCVWNGSVLMRKNLIKKLKGYNESKQTGEDWDFFLRSIGVAKFHNIQEYLSIKRIHPASISFTKQAIKETEDILLSFNNSVIENNNDKEKKGNAYFNIGYHYYYKNDFGKATEYFSKAAAIGGLSLQTFRYYFICRFFKKFIKFYRKYKLFKMLDWMRYLDKSNKYLRNKY